MAIVETLEIRFAAKLGNLGVQIAAVTGALMALGGRSTAVLGSVAAAALMAGSAVDRVGLAAQSAEKRQARLASRLKKTGKALKGVSSAARQAAEGIGLHKMDEVNLTAAAEQKSSSSGGRKGASLSVKGASAGLDELLDAFDGLPGFFERLKRALKKNLGGLDSWLNRATGGLAGMLVNALGNAGKSAAEAIGEKLGAGMSAFKSVLFARGGELVRSAGDGMQSSAMNASAPVQAGSAMVGKLRSGMLGGVSGVKNAAESVTSAAKFGSEAATSSAQSAGLDLSKGFAGGMLSYLDKIREAAGRLASAALDKLKNLLKIASPSRVTFSFGGYFAQGFAGGIAASAHLAAESAAMLSGGAVAALNTGVMGVGGESGLGGMVRAAVGDALGNASLTIPLNVDGIKLGEAAIRGINRVTRASGRLMLDI